MKLPKTITNDGDGTGYPCGLARESIPESARILAIVDVYDALTHDRVYRPALPEDEVFEILRQGNGSHFDSALLALFICNLEEIRSLAEANPDQHLTTPQSQLKTNAPAFRGLELGVGPTPVPIC